MPTLRESPKVAASSHPDAALPPLDALNIASFETKAPNVPAEQTLKPLEADSTVVDFSRSPHCCPLTVWLSAIFGWSVWTLIIVLALALVPVPLLAVVLLHTVLVPCLPEWVPREVSTRGLQALEQRLLDDQGLCRTTVEAVQLPCGIIAR